MNKHLPRLALVALGAGLIATGAHAANPESGAVSKAAPKFSWTGTLDQSYPQYTAMQPETAAGAPCEAPGCDTFTLEVAPDAAGFPLSFAIGQDGGFVGLRITAPDGTVTMEKVASESASKPATFSVAKAQAGKYELAITDNSITPVAYKGTATLKVPAPEPGAEPTPAPTAPASGTPAPSGGGQQTSPPPATTMSVAAGRASAKKLKKARKLLVEISVSAPVTGVVAKILKGKKALATGKAARVDNVGKVTVKLRKPLRKGSYAIQVTGTDGQGRPVSGSAKLKVSK